MAKALPDRSAADAGRLAQAMGWFSLGLGVTQLLAPGRVNTLIGVRDDRRSRFWQRVIGVQEISAAAGIFSERRPVEWLWGRTAADVVHLTMLARARRGRCKDPARLEGAMASVVGTFAADAYASAGMTSDPEVTRKGSTPMKAQASITIRAEREEVQRRWRDFEQSDDARLGPIEIVGEQFGRLTEWRTTDAANAKAFGVAIFTDAPAGRGTEIHVSFEFDVMGGAVGAAVKKVTGDEPPQMVQDDLRRFKQVVEAGEIARSDGAPTGHSARLQPKQRPAQPLEHAPA